MKKMISLILIAFTLNASAQQLSHADSLVLKHKQDSVTNLIQSKMVINASFIDSVMQVVSTEMKKAFTIDQTDEYYKALNIQQYIIQRLVKAWTDQYAVKQKVPK